jgi:hypothetical protein
MAMKTPQRTEKSLLRRAALLVVIVTAGTTLSACSHTMMMLHGPGAKRPAPSEFGLGPRSSDHGHYLASLEPERQLRPRQMQTLRVTVTDGRGRAIDGATLTIEGGMPQHGHGLPTRPRVTRQLGGGAYQLEGVRFNMGGWWELKVAIAGEAGPDTVTFNLDL